MMLHKKPVKKLIPFSFAAFAILATMPTHAGSLENLERERANVINILLSPSIPAEQRIDKIHTSRYRLVDMERMVLRDKTLEGKNTPEVRIAFQNYDLTFLAHASIEKDISIMELWLAQIGITTNSIMNTRMGRR